jgi:TetR/AcrR family transcriptional repressor of nem operon
LGNKRQFDEEVVLDQLASHFWKHGYSATKVDQLSEITGLTKTSLYNAFGNKEALFLHSINFYVDKSIGEMMGYLDTDLSLSGGLERLLNDSFLTVGKTQLSFGCFLTNSIVELNANETHLHAEATALFDNVREAKLKFFSHYVVNNKIKKGFSAEELTDCYMTLLQGLRVQSRNHGALSKIDNSIKTFLKFIKSVELK